MVEWKSRIPALSGNEQIDMRRVLDYTLQLSEEMRYHLNNLDLSNFNSAEWAQYTDGMLEISAEQLAIAVGKLEIKINDTGKGLENRLNLSVEGMKQEISQYLTDTDGTISEKLNTWQNTVDGMSQTISQKVTDIDGTMAEKLNTWQNTVDGMSQTISQKVTDVDNTMVEKLNIWQQTVNGYKQQITETFKGYEGTYVKSTDIEIMAGQVSTIVSELGEDGEVTVASIAAKIAEDESLIELIAGEVDIDGVTKFTNISDGDNQTIIDGAKIRSEGEWSYQYTEIDGGSIKLGDMGSISVGDAGFVWMKSGNLRLDSDGDFVIAAHSASNGAVYIYPCAQYASVASRYGWRFKQKTIDHWDPTRGTWVTLVQG